MEASALHSRFNVIARVLGLTLFLLLGGARFHSFLGYLISASLFSRFTSSLTVTSVSLLTRLLILSFLTLSCLVKLQLPHLYSHFDRS